MKPKSICLAAVALLCSLSLAACSASQSAPAETAAEAAALPAEPSVQAEIAPDAVVAEIGSRKILRSSLMSEYNAMLYMYSYYGYPTPSTEQEVEEAQDMVIASMVGDMLLLHQADEMGITPLDEETVAEIEAQFESEKQEQMDVYRAYAEDEGAEDVEARAIEIFNEELNSYGWGMDYDSYWDYHREYLETNKILEILEEEVRAAVTVTEEDAKAYYDTLLENDTAAYSEDAAAYAADREYYDMFEGTPLTYVPEGYLRVKVITLAPEEAADASLLENESSLKELESEYGRLALTGADPERMAQIEAEYPVLSEETAALRARYMGTAREKAADIAARLEAGEDFDTLLAEYDTEGGYTTYPAFGELGRLLYTSGGDGWSELVRAAALSLQDGEHSDMMEDVDAIYFVKRMGVETAGAVPFETVAEAVFEGAAASVKDAAWEEKSGLWYSDDSGVTYYRENYRDIGK